MIVLQILKIIGIALACLLGFVVLLIILVLCTPITYKLHAEGGTDGGQITANARVKWLAGLLTAGADFADKNLRYYIKVLGIKVFKGDLQGEKAADEETYEKNQTDIIKSPVQSTLSHIFSKESYEQKVALSGKDTRQIYRKMESDIRQEEREIKERLKEEKRLEKQKIKEEKKQNKKSLPERIEAFAEKIKEKYNKAKELYEKIKTAKYIIGAPVTKRALHILKKQLLNMLGSIRPRYMKGYLAFSTGDPATTAQIYGAGGTVASMIDSRLVIIPYIESDEKMLAADACTGGRIFAGYLVICALKIILSRDVRRVLKYSRKHLFSDKTNAK